MHRDRENGSELDRDPARHPELLGDLRIELRSGRVRGWRREERTYWPGGMPQAEFIVEEVEVAPSDGCIAPRTPGVAPGRALHRAVALCTGVAAYRAADGPGWSLLWGLAGAAIAAWLLARLTARQ